MSKPDVPNGTQAANGASKNPEDSTMSRAKQAIKAWNGFQDAAKELLKYSEALGKVEEVLDRHDDIEKEIQSKDVLVARWESAVQVQTDGYDKRYSTWKEEKCRLENRVKDLETDLATRAGAAEKQKFTTAQAVTQIKKDLDNEKKTVAKLAKELETANNKTQEANKKLGRCSEQLKEWEGNLSHLKELDLKVL